MSPPENGDAQRCDSALADGESHGSMSPSEHRHAAARHQLSTAWIVVGVVALLLGLFFGLVMSSVGS